MHGNKRDPSRRHQSLLPISVAVVITWEHAKGTKILLQWVGRVDAGKTLSLSLPLPLEEPSTGQAGRTVPPAVVHDCVSHLSGRVGC